jgi:hypothetical protein
MEKNNSAEKALWSGVTKMFSDESITLGTHWSYNLRNDPKRLAFVLSRYKFSAKMSIKGASILELGCSEGIGVPILSESAKAYTGVDSDKEAIDSAITNWSAENINFISDDFLDKKYGIFDTVVCLDVIEHIVKEYEHLFFKTVFDNVHEDGIAIIGTPNITSSPYASSASQSGHVNLFDNNQLQIAMNSVFSTVLMFGGNDEVVHTGFAPMNHYLIALGCGKKESFTYGIR